MAKRHSAYNSASYGFTLLEILIAIAILSIVLSTVYASYSGALTIIRDLDDDSRIYDMARTTLDRINRDLSSLQRYGDDYHLQSEARDIGSRAFGSLTFWSSAHLAFQEKELAHSPAFIAYFVKEDKKSGKFSLWRSDIAQARPSFEKKPDGGIIICEDIQSLSFKFYDESGQEYSSWDTTRPGEDQQGKPPRRVSIELLLANARDAQKPHVFVTRLFLPVKK